MTKRKKIIIGAAGSILILGGLIVFGIKRSSETNLLQPNPNLPKSEWPRLIQVKEENQGAKLAINQIDGYQITVPSNWHILDVASAAGGLKAFYNPQGNYESTEFSEGVMLNILTLKDIEEAKGYFPPTARFEDRKIGDRPAYRTSYQLTRETSVNGKLVEAPVAKSLVIGYLVPADKNKKIYLISCLALGDAFNELASLCENQISTFKILK
jgi:hypothetical protein